MISADHGAIDHLQFVRCNPRAVQRVQDVLPQPCECPVAEPAADLEPLAELFGQVTPGRAGARVVLRLAPVAACAPPENAIQNKALTGGFTSVWMSNGLDERLTEGPLAGYQVACQARSPKQRQA